MRRALAAAAAIIFAASGCGKGEEAQIQEAARAYFVALATGDVDSATERVSAAHARRLVEIYGPVLDRRSFAGYVTHEAEDADRDGAREARRLHLTGVEIRGEHAVATLRGATATTRLEFVRSRGGWVFDGFVRPRVRRPARPMRCPSDRFRRHPSGTPRLDVRRLLGARMGDARILAGRFGCEVRVTRQDGYSPYGLSADLRLDRIDVETWSDVVVRVGIG